MIISKFDLKKYCNLNILILKFSIKKLQEIFCLSYEYEFSIINIYIKIYSLRSIKIDFIEKKIVSQICIFCVFYEKIVNFKKIN